MTSGKLSCLALALAKVEMNSTRQGASFDTLQGDAEGSMRRRQESRRVSKRVESESAPLFPFDRRYYQSQLRSRCTGLLPRTRR